MAGQHGNEVIGKYNPEESAMVLIDRKELAELRKALTVIRGASQAAATFRDLQRTAHKALTTPYTAIAAEKEKT